MIGPIGDCWPVLPCWCLVARRWRGQPRGGGAGYLPTLVANERYEGDGDEHLVIVALVGAAGDEDKVLLAAAAADGHNEPAAERQLRPQRFGYSRAAGGDDDTVVGGVFGPAKRAVATANPHVVIAKVGQPVAGVVGQLAVALDGIDFAGDAAED